MKIEILDTLFNWKRNLSVMPKNLFWQTPNPLYRLNVSPLSQSARLVIIKPTLDTFRDFDSEAL